MGIGIGIGPGIWHRDMAQGIGIEIRDKDGGIETNRDWDRDNAEKNKTEKTRPDPIP